MPTYDYECDACGHEFELFQQISDPVKRKCPECGKLKLRRLFGTGAAVVFKGSGFYETDYRSDSYKKGEEKDEEGRRRRSPRRNPTRRSRNEIGLEEEVGDSKPKAEVERRVAFGY